MIGVKWGSKRVKAPTSSPTFIEVEDVIDVSICPW
jgi:hypothetical protein